MGFVFEEINSSDAIKYGLNEEVEYCVIDRARNIYLWGGREFGHWMPIAEGNDNWKFHLIMEDCKCEFILEKGEGSSKFSDNPYIIRWNKIVNMKIDAKKISNDDKKNLLNLLKEAVTVYGGGYQANKYFINFTVIFDF